MLGNCELKAFQEYLVYEIAIVSCVLVHSIDFGTVIIGQQFQAHIATKPPSHHILATLHGQNLFIKCIEHFLRFVWEKHFRKIKVFCFLSQFSLLKYFLFWDWITKKIFWQMLNFKLFYTFCPSWLPLKSPFQKSQLY